jgi:hypothetical protein
MINSGRHAPDWILFPRKLALPQGAKTEKHKTIRKEATMKPTTKILLTLTYAYAIATASSFGQLVYTFDENGNSTGPSSGPPITPGTPQPDPSGALGLTVPVLVYNLLAPVVQGDVVLTEPGNPATGETYSDVIRFWNPTGVNATQIIFYSDNSTTEPGDVPPDTGLADTGLPPQLITPVFIPEVGPEGNNGATYTPAPARPDPSRAQW